MVIVLQLKLHTFRFDVIAQYLIRCFSFLKIFLPNANPASCKCLISTMIKTEGPSFSHLFLHIIFFILGTNFEHQYKNHNECLNGENA